MGDSKKFLENFDFSLALSALLSAQEAEQPFDFTQARGGGAEPSTLKGNLRAIGQSKIEKTLQVTEVRELGACLSDLTERAGFEPAVGVYTPTTV